MITINLLPTEFRRKLEESHVVSLRFGMIVACLIALFLWIGLSFMLGTSKGEFENLSTDWKRLELGAKEADKIMLDINQNFLERKKTCDLIGLSDMSWAYVINRISDLLPDTAWLKKMKLSSNTMDEWEFWIKGMVKPPEKEPAIKVIGRYVGEIKPALEQPLKTLQASAQASAAGSGSVVPATRNLNVQTSTDQEILNNIEITSFETTYTLKGKKDETVRDKSKNP